MGTWGPKLYQNDVSQDVRSEYKDKLRRLVKEEEITSILINKHQRAIQDEDDRTNFWLALADTQWELGRLEDHVKDCALECIENGGDIKVWEAESPKLAKIRAKVLDDVKTKLLSPQPPKKEIKPYRLYTCEWNIGDVYAYKFTGDYAKEHGFEGRYLLVQKISNGSWHPGHTVPIVYAKITPSDRLPQSVEEYNSIKYIRFNYLTPDSIQHKLDRNNMYGNDNRTEGLPGIPDKSGKVYVYRLQLIHTSKRSIPKSLVYVGNFAHADAPEHEGYYYILGGVNLYSYYWKEIEERILNDYKRSIAEYDY